MATSSSTKLTKFTSSKTIVTADFANSLFGGLYGSTEGDALDSDDPRVAGHIHDGVRGDGHAQKIDLVDHVTNQLTNTNLADGAVTKRNIASFTDSSSAIPASEVIDGVTYYYLDIDSGNGFLTVAISANGGTVSGDGAGSIVADDASDTLNIEAGPGINITTTLADDRFLISATQQNLFDTISQGNTGTGTSSGGPLLADSTSDTLKFEADDGIDVTLSDGAGGDTVTIKNISENFGIIALAGVGAEFGITSGSTPVEADLLKDTVTFEAGYGMELVGDAGADAVKFRTQYSLVQEVINLDDWTNGTAGGWGVTAVRHYTDPDSDPLSYQYRVVNDDDWVYGAVPIPQNNQGERPRRFLLKAYFIVKDVTTAYIAAIDPDPAFVIDLQVGSDDSQTLDTQLGTISDDEDITAGAQNLWSTSIPQASTGVSGPNKLYVVSWALQALDITVNNLGLLYLRMIGNDPFGAGQHFSGEDGKAEVQFIKADIIWHF